MGRTCPYVGRTCSYVGRTCSYVGRTFRSGILAVAWVLLTAAPLAQTASVRHHEGLVHGFLKLSTTGGTRLASGDLLQTSSGNRVTSRVVFRFKDGSLHDETAIFTQGRTFQLARYHLIQKGRAFPRSLDMTIDRAKGRVVVRHTDDGRPEVDEEQMELPATLVNGMVSIVLKNVRPADLPLELWMVVATPKPRLVKIEVTSAGDVPFSTAGAPHKAIHYVLHPELGGLTGLIAPLVGRKPPDSHVWILGGPVPAFVKAEYPLYAEGPIWRIELTSPVFK